MNNSNPTYKIAVSGTSCVGKTTIVNQLARIYIEDQDVYFVPEAAREYFVQNPMPESRRFLLETQAAIQDYIMQQEKVATDNLNKVVICDNSVLTAAAFTAAGDGLEKGMALVDRVSDWLPSYDVFYILDPAPVPYRTDEVRQETPEFRQYVHEMYITILNQSGIEYTVLGGSLDNRIIKIQDKINNYRVM